MLLNFEGRDHFAFYALIEEAEFMPKGSPQGEGKQAQGKEQVNGEAEVTDGGTVNQSAGDHVPAHECLRDEQHAHHEVNAEFLEGNCFLEKEVENRDGIEQALPAVQ